MTEYLTVPIEVDQQDVLQLAYTYIQTYFPNWKPADGNLDVAILEAMSTDAASLRELATSVPDTIFRWFGATIVQVQPIDATPATSTATFTMIDTAGYTVPAGTQVAIPATGDTSVVFETLVDAVVAPGASNIAGVSIQAVDDGAAGSALGTPGETIQLIDSLAFVSGVTLDAETAGGVDAETDETYLTRLVHEMQLLSPRLIIPSDFTQDAKDQTGVTRALAIDGYNPADSTYNNPRMVTVVAVDSAGNTVDAAIKTAIQNSAEAKREVNFIVNITDPHYTNIDVTFDVAAISGFDTATLVTAIETAVTAWLQPYTWGVDPVTLDPTTWTDKQTLRYMDLVSVIYGVGGVAYIKTLTMGIHGGAMGTTDIALTAPASLTTPGTITGTAE